MSLIFPFKFCYFLFFLCFRSVRNRNRNVCHSPCRGGEGVCHFPKFMKWLMGFQKVRHKRCTKIFTPSLTNRTDSCWPSCPFRDLGRMPKSRIECAKGRKCRWEEGGTLKYAFRTVNECAAYLFSTAARTHLVPVIQSLKMCDCFMNKLETTNPVSTRILQKSFRFAFRRLGISSYHILHNFVQRTTEMN